MYLTQVLSLHAGLARKGRRDAARGLGPGGVSAICGESREWSEPDAVVAKGGKHGGACLLDGECCAVGTLRRWHTGGPGCSKTQILRLGPRRSGISYPFHYKAPPQVCMQSTCCPPPIPSSRSSCSMAMGRVGSCTVFKSMTLRWKEKSILRAASSCFSPLQVDLPNVLTTHTLFYPRTTRLLPYVKSPTLRPHYVFLPTLCHALPRGALHHRHCPLGPSRLPRHA